MNSRVEGEERHRTDTRTGTAVDTGEIGAGLERTVELPSSDAAPTPAPSPPPHGTAPTERIEPADWRTGTSTRLGRYLVVDQVGAGGMGVVFRAYDPGLNREVALKVLHVTSGGRWRDRLLREAQALAKLSHPNVIQVHDVGSDGDRVFLAMELVRGVTLRTWARQAPRSTGEVLEVFLAAGHGLMAAHAAGMVHRDFKPSNVMVGDDGRVRVLDFGLARAPDDERLGQPPEGDTGLSTERVRPARPGGSEADSASRPANRTTRPQRGRPPASDSSSGSRTPSAASLSPDLVALPLTQAGAVLGTPAYMAPEQWRGEADARTDQFAFCAALYEGLTGHLPFDGEDRSAVQRAMAAHAIRPYPARSEVPPRVRAAIRRGLSPHPPDRFPSLAELLQVLEPRRRSRGLVAVVAVAALGIAATTTAMAARGEAAPPQPCAAAGDRIAAIWNPAVDGRLAAAFAAAGPSGAAVWPYARKAIDSYATGWASMRRDTCEATVVRGEQSPALMDLRMRCLDDRLGELGSVLETFSRADRGLLDRSVRAVPSVSALAACADGRTLTAMAPRPADLLSRVRIALLGDIIAAIQTDLRVGHRSHLAERASAAVAEARALHYGPLLARAIQVDANVEREAGRSEPAIALQREGIREADRAGDDLIRADLMLDLMSELGDDKPADARDVGTAVEALLDRLDRPDVQVSRLYAQRAMALERAGEFRPGLAEIDRALAILRRLPSPPTGALITALNARSMILQRLEDQEGSIAALREAQAVAEERLGHENPTAVALLTNLSDALAGQQHYDEAEAGYREGLAVLERLYGSEHPQIAIVLSELASLLRDVGRNQEALPLAVRAVAIDEKLLPPDSATTALALHALATIQSRLGDPATEATYQRALAMTQKALGPEHPRVGNIYEDMGRRAMGQHRPEIGGPLWQKALAIAEKAYGPDNLRVAQAQVSLAGTYLARDDFRGARPLAETAFAWAERHEVPRTRGIAAFYLAVALWDGGGDRVRAKRLLGLAIADSTATEDRSTLHDLDSFFEDHPGVRATIEVPSR